MDNNLNEQLAEQLAEIARQHEHLIKPGTCRKPCRATCANGKPCAHPARPESEFCGSHKRQCPTWREQRFGRRPATPPATPATPPDYVTPLQALVDMQVARYGRRKNWFSLVMALALQHGWTVAFRPSTAKRNTVESTTEGNRLIIWLDTERDDLGLLGGLRLCLGTLLKTLGYDVETGENFLSDSFVNAVEQVRAKYDKEA